MQLQLYSVMGTLSIIILAIGKRQLFKSKVNTTRYCAQYMYVSGHMNFADPPYLCFVTGRLPSGLSLDNWCTDLDGAGEVQNMVPGCITHDYSKCEIS